MNTLDKLDKTDRLATQSARNKSQQIAAANRSIAQRTSAATAAARSAATPAIRTAAITQPADSIRGLADHVLAELADGPDALPAGNTPSAADYAALANTKAARSEIFRRATSPGSGKPVMVR